MKRKKASTLPQRLQQPARQPPSDARSCPREAPLLQRTPRPTSSADDDGSSPLPPDGKSEDVNSASEDEDLCDEDAVEKRPPRAPPPF